MKASPNLPAHVRWAGIAAPDAIVRSIAPIAAPDAPAPRTKPRRRRRKDFPQPVPDTAADETSEPKRLLPASGELPRPTQPLPPAAELTRLLSVRENEIRLARIVDELAELELHDRRIVAASTNGHCPMCERQLDAGSFEGLRAGIQHSIQSLTVDRRYFEQRLEQLGELRIAERQPITDVDYTPPFSVIDDDDDLPF